MRYDALEYSSCVFLLLEMKVAFDRKTAIDVEY
jgi:hypothetical protein